MPRHRAATTLALLAAALATACGTVQSVNPAIAGSEALAAPELEGHWVAVDSSSGELHIDLVRQPGEPPSYRLRLSEIDLAGARRDPIGHRDSTIEWHDVRIGRIGGQLVIETSRADTTPAARRTWEIHTADADASGLRVGALRTDSALARIRSARCATSFRYVDSTRTLTLTGDSRLVRDAYACILRGAGAVDPVIVFARGPAR